VDYIFFGNLSFDYLLCHYSRICLKGKSKSKTTLLQAQDFVVRLQKRSIHLLLTALTVSLVSLLSAGIVNRGDSFRRRRSRSNSLVPPQILTSPAPDCTPPASPTLAVTATAPDVVTYRVAMIGAQGVGKSALVSQFMTSECINAYDRQRGELLPVSSVHMSTQVTAISRQLYWPGRKPEGKHLLGKPRSTWQNNVSCGRFECSRCSF
jgi:hypothetical protein